MSWHADAGMIGQYITGRIDEATASSLEAHLMRCPDCRSALVASADTERLSAIWDEVREQVDAPVPGIVERLLLSLGVRDHTARLLAATPTLSLSWIAGIAFVLAFAILAAGNGPKGLVWFLLVAPLLPVAGVALAYGPGIDPFHEIALAARIDGFRLMALRAVAVLSTTTVLSAAAALALPVVDWRAAAWLLPALGLTLATLALSTYVAAPAAAGSVSLAWAGFVLVLFRPGRPPASPILLVQTQMFFLLIAAVAFGILVSRRWTFDGGRQL